MVWRNKPLGSTTRRSARRGRMARNIVYRLDHNKMVPIEIRCALSHSMIACHSPISWGAHHWMTNLCWQNWRRRRRPDAVAAWPKINVYRLDQNKIDPIEIRCSMIACRCPLISMGCSSLNDTPILAKKKAPEPARRRRRRRTQNSADPTKLLGPKGPKSHIILSQW